MAPGTAAGGRENFQLSRFYLVVIVFLSHLSEMTQVWLERECVHSLIVELLLFFHTITIFSILLLLFFHTHVPPKREWE